LAIFLAPRFLEPEQPLHLYVPFSYHCILVRNYSVLKKDATYRRRVSWLGIGTRESIALVEYFGKFPGLSQHGNGKEGTEYIRTPATSFFKTE
jgi:hypothetical protein